MTPLRCWLKWEGDFGEAYAAAVLDRPLNNRTVNLIAQGKSGRQAGRSRAAGVARDGL